MRIIAIMLGLLNMLYGLSGCNRGLYSLDATVVESKNGVVVFEASDGNVWEAYGDFDGESVVLVMNDCGTPEAEDDEVVGFFGRA